MFLFYLKLSQIKFFKYNFKPINISMKKEFPLILILLIAMFFFSGCTQSQQFNLPSQFTQAGEATPFGMPASMVEQQCMQHVWPSDCGMVPDPAGAELCEKCKELGIGEIRGGAPPTQLAEGEKCGALRSDETWSGEIHAICGVTVMNGVTLTIEPGTLIKFKHDRDYKTFDRASLSIQGGTIKAIGTSEEQIWFTSDADTPINGDWHGIIITDSQDSEFQYVIIEFAELGLSQMDSSVLVENSIIRWNNSEGLYAERSSPIYRNNTFYSNAYHDIALEQFNENVQIINNIFKGGYFSVHHEKTSSLLQGNYFTNYTDHAITAGMESEIIVKENRFENIGQSNPIHFYDGSTAEISDNDFGEGTIAIPEFDYEDIKMYELPYLPNSEEDQYPYVYDTIDDTRKTIKKIGEGLSFGWALEYANNYLYRFSLGDGEVGTSLDFIKVNPETGEFEKFGNNEIMNPRGLTHDGEFFYVNDFSLLKIFKFQLNESTGFIEILDSFDIPEKEEGGVQGLTNDGEFLYLCSRSNNKLFQLSKTGELISEIHSTTGEIGDSLVWTGEFFWTNGGCEKGFCKFSKQGTLLGEAYQPAKEAWAMTWDGQYLWTIQRTNELWNDPKIYQIEILNDSLN